MQAHNYKRYSTKAIKPKKKTIQLSFLTFLLLCLFIITIVEIFIISIHINKKAFADEDNIEKSMEGRNITRSEVKEILNVPVIGQFPELPRGCEVTAVAMLLGWAGIDVSKEELARAIPKGSVPVLRNGVLFGSNPNEVFVGDPFSNSGFGVYHKPIADLINSYLPGKAEDITGQPFENIIKTVDEGRPVIVWATIDLAQPKLVALWRDEQGREVRWISPEHTFLLVGYSDEYVIMNDPYTGKRREFSIPLFKKIWESMGNQAVTVNKDTAGEVVVTKLTVTTDDSIQSAKGAKD